MGFFLPNFVLFYPISCYFIYLVFFLCENVPYKDITIQFCQIWLYLISPWKSNLKLMLINYWYWAVGCCLLCSWRTWEGETSYWGKEKIPLLFGVFVTFVRFDYWCYMFISCSTWKEESVNMTQRPLSSFTL